jgi:hypothetical protein
MTVTCRCLGLTAVVGLISVSVDLWHTSQEWEPGEWECQEWEWSHLPKKSMATQLFLRRKE